MVAFDRIHRCPPDAANGIVQLLRRDIPVIAAVDFDAENVMPNIFGFQVFGTIAKFKVFYSQTLMNMVSGNGIGQGFRRNVIHEVDEGCFGGKRLFLGQSPVQNQPLHIMPCAFDLLDPLKLRLLGSGGFSAFRFVGKHSIAGSFADIEDLIVSRINKGVDIESL